jgi:hypothetical protein
MTLEEATRSALTDQQALICTLYGEAAGETMSSRVAVACAIRNRVLADLGNDGKPDWWGEGYRGVCLKKWQFSCWWETSPNTKRLYAFAQHVLSGTPPPFQRDQILQAELAAIADGIMSGRMEDVTHGATHYLTIKLLQAKPPAWTSKMQRVATIGAHAYFKE